MTHEEMSEDVDKIRSLIADLEKAVSLSFIGSDDIIRLAILGLVGGFHVLIEDIPGVGKTTLALALAQAVGMSFSRIQFTPDMLPGDVLGMSIWDPTLHEFVFREGPVNAQFILADELNRTSPRTQSAFLEAMQEGQITVEGKTRRLPCPFFLIATQNPNNFAGTFPLPEAELDRFGLAFSIGYPSQEREAEILRRRAFSTIAADSGVEGSPSITDIKPVTKPEIITETRRAISRLHVADSLSNYIVQIIRETRRSPNIRLGASPRAALFLQQASRARAAAEGRVFVIPEDVEAMAPFVLAHRIQISSQARLSQLDANQCIREICALVKKPTGL